MTAIIRTSPLPLMKVEEARAFLAQCKSVDEVKNVRDKAEALRGYLRQQSASRDMQNDAAEIKVRAERRIGQLLIDMKESGTRANQGTHKKSHDDTSSAPTLAELGIGKMSANRWQDIARASDDVFETYIAEARNDEITSKGALNAAKAATREPKEPEPFHAMLAVGDLKELIRDEIGDWPLEARRLVPQVLRYLADEIESGLPR